MRATAGQTGLLIICLGSGAFCVAQEPSALKADEADVVAAPYRGRVGDHRALVARGGGTDRVESGVRSGLAWLARHQSDDGSWRCAGFRSRCLPVSCGGIGASKDYDVGVTALALLAFAGAGHSLTVGEHRESVRAAVRYLSSLQAEDGCLGRRVADGHFIYNHAIGTAALAEIHALSGRQESLQPVLSRAVAFLLRAQNPGRGWRYGIRPGDTDTSVTSWAVYALRAAEFAGLDVPDSAFAGAKNWIGKVTDEPFFHTGYSQKGDEGGGLAACVPHPESHWGTTAMALTARLLLGESPEAPLIAGGADRLRADLPAWDGDRKRDFHYWCFGSFAMFQVGGDHWAAWSTALTGTLLPRQVALGCEAGSWEPSGAFGNWGGRVYATAMGVLALESYYRFTKQSAWTPAKPR